MGSLPKRQGEMWGLLNPNAWWGWLWSILWLWSIWWAIPPVWWTAHRGGWMVLVAFVLLFLVYNGEPLCVIIWSGRVNFSNKSDVKCDQLRCKNKKSPYVNLKGSVLLWPMRLISRIARSNIFAFCLVFLTGGEPWSFVGLLAASLSNIKPVSLISSGMFFSWHLFSCPSLC